MIKTWKDKSKGWRRWFAILPIVLRDGHKRTFVWMQWVWVKGNGLYVEVSLEDPLKAGGTQ